MNIVFESHCFNDYISWKSLTIQRSFEGEDFDLNEDTLNEIISLMKDLIKKLDSNNLKDIVSYCFYSLDQNNSDLETILINHININDLRENWITYFEFLRDSIVTLGEEVDNYHCEQCGDYNESWKYLLKN